MMPTGSKNIKSTSWSGNIESKKEKFEINKDKLKEPLQLKRKNKEKKNNSSKNTLRKSSSATS